MQELKQALEEVKAIHAKVFGVPAPDLAPAAFVPFPPGVDPIQGALADARALKDMWEQLKLAPRPSAWMPPADAYATDTEFIVHVDIPGISREDVKVLLVAGECVVRGERKPPAHGMMRVLAQERPWGPFERRFILPPGSRADEMKARISSGLLELRIPVDRPENEREQKIEVD